uniref:ATR interacting protein n=1 Tax=Mola mola TaxID=94237 RepID=A0A3Q3X6P0_MOLML
MTCPPTKRLRGLDHDEAMQMAFNDPFGDDEAFTQDDLDEIDIISSQAITSTPASGLDCKPGAKPAELTGGSSWSVSRAATNHSTFGSSSSNRDDAYSLLEAQHAELKRKLKEVEEEIVLKSGEIRVLRDSLKGAQQEKEAQRQNQILLDSQRQREQSERAKELNKKVQSLQSELQFKEAEINEMKSKLHSSDRNKMGSPLPQNRSVKSRVLYLLVIYSETFIMIIFYLVQFVHACYHCFNSVLLRVCICVSLCRSCPGAVLLLPLLDLHLSRLSHTLDSLSSTSSGGSNSSTASSILAVHAVPTGGPLRLEGLTGFSMDDVGLAALRLLYLLVAHIYFSKVVLLFFFFCFFFLSSGLVPPLQQCPAPSPPWCRGIAASLLRECLMLLHWLLLHHGSFSESCRPLLHMYDQVIPAVRDTLRRIPELSESEELALEEICRSDGDEADDMEVDATS